MDTEIHVVTTTMIVGSRSDGPHFRLCILDFKK